MPDAFDFDDKRLEQLIKAFKGQIPEAKVGILSGSARKDGGTNAQVGAAHEYGTTKLPRRSFLRVPITENLGSYLESSGAFDKQALMEVIASGDITPWMRKIAVTAERVVDDAFATGGFGQWPQSKMENKKNHQTLVETQQLRNSISSEVK